MALIGYFHYILFFARAKEHNELGEKLLTLSPPIHSHFMLYRNYLNLKISSLFSASAHAAAKHYFRKLTREVDFLHTQKTKA